MSSYRMKSWEELTICDDYMFKLIMSRKRICRKVLERILHVEISDIHYLEAEKPMKPSYRSKGVRLDVYVRVTCIQSTTSRCRFASPRVTVLPRGRVTTSR